MWRRMRQLLTVIALVWSTTAVAEVVEVRGRGEVDLRRFVCETVLQSAIRRVCYDEINQYLVSC